ncbi:MAG TPA: mechanosensitive ion channel family protein [Puia sp.]|jgi:small-conductance mechanosensitive channel
MDSFLDNVFWGNSIKIWLLALGFVALSLTAVRILKAVVLKKLKKWAEKTKGNFDDLLVTLLGKVVIPLFYILSFYFGAEVLQTNAKVQKIMDGAVMVIITWSVLRFITSLIAFSFARYMQRQPGELREKQGRGILLIVNVIVWIVGFVFVIDNFGYNITTIITGLGVGGIAIALAAQAILGDLFSYLVIFFDKPFEIGDFIIVDDKLGTIEYIGIKTTRIRTLSGEQLICSNSALTSSWVHNYKRMEKRRIVFSFGVVYQTPIEQIRKIPGIVKGIIESQKNTQFDRAHFLKFGNSSLDFEVVYNVMDPDYNIYMDKQQAINLALMEQLESEGIEFAYPTQTLFVTSQESSNQLLPAKRLSGGR